MQDMAPQVIGNPSPDLLNYNRSCWLTVSVELIGTYPTRGVLLFKFKQELSAKFGEMTKPVSLFRCDLW
jgi:hypothetical protein